jgi:hypothetical protein
MSTSNLNVPPLHPVSQQIPPSPQTPAQTAPTASGDANSQVIQQAPVGQQPVAQVVRATAERQLTLRRRALSRADMNSIPPDIVSVAQRRATRSQLDPTETLKRKTTQARLRAASDPKAMARTASRQAEREHVLNVKQKAHAVVVEMQEQPGAKPKAQKKKVLPQPKEWMRGLNYSVTHPANVAAKTGANFAMQLGAASAQANWGFGVMSEVVPMGQFFDMYNKGSAYRRFHQDNNKAIKDLREAQIKIGKLRGERQMLLDSGTPKDSLSIVEYNKKLKVAGKTAQDIRNKLAANREAMAVKTARVVRDVPFQLGSATVGVLQGGSRIAQAIGRTIPNLTATTATGAVGAFNIISGAANLADGRREVKENVALQRKRHPKLLLGAGLVQAVPLRKGKDNTAANVVRCFNNHVYRGARLEKRAEVLGWARMGRGTVDMVSGSLMTAGLGFGLVISGPGLLMQGVNATVWQTGFVAPVVGCRVRAKYTAKERQKQADTFIRQFGMAEARKVLRDNAAEHPSHEDVKKGEHPFANEYLAIAVLADDLTQLTAGNEEDPDVQQRAQAARTILMQLGVTEEELDLAELAARVDDIVVDEFDEDRGVLPDVKATTKRYKALVAAAFGARIFDDQSLGVIHKDGESLAKTLIFGNDEDAALSGLKAHYDAMESHKLSGLDSSLKRLRDNHDIDRDDLSLALAYVQANPQIYLKEHEQKLVEFLKQLVSQCDKQAEVRQGTDVESFKGAAASAKKLADARSALRTHFKKLKNFTDKLNTGRSAYEKAIWAGSAIAALGEKKITPKDLDEMLDALNAQLEKKEGVLGIQKRTEGLRDALQALKDYLASDELRGLAAKLASDDIAQSKNEDEGLLGLLGDIPAVHTAILRHGKSLDAFLKLAGGNVEPSIDGQLLLLRIRRTLFEQGITALKLGEAAGLLEEDLEDGKSADKEFMRNLHYALNILAEVRLPGARSKLGALEAADIIEKTIAEEARFYDGTVFSAGPVNRMLGKQDELIQDFVWAKIEIKMQNTIAVQAQDVESSKLSVRTSLSEGLKMLAGLEGNEGLVAFAGKNAYSKLQDVKARLEGDRKRKKTILQLAGVQSEIRGLAGKVSNFTGVYENLVSEVKSCKRALSGARLFVTDIAKEKQKLVELEDALAQFKEGIGQAVLINLSVNHCIGIDELRSLEAKLRNELPAKWDPARLTHGWSGLVRLHSSLEMLIDFMSVDSPRDDKAAVQSPSEDTSTVDSHTGNELALASAADIDSATMVLGEIVRQAGTDRINSAEREFSVTPEFLEQLESDLRDGIRKHPRTDAYRPTIKKEILEWFDDMLEVCATLANESAKNSSTRTKAQTEEGQPLDDNDILKLFDLRKALPEILDKAIPDRLESSESSERGHMSGGSQSESSSEDTGVPQTTTTRTITPPQPTTRAPLRSIPPQSSSQTGVSQQQPGPAKWPLALLRDTDVSTPAFSTPPRAPDFVKRYPWGDYKVALVGGKKWQYNSRPVDEYKDAKGSTIHLYTGYQGGKQHQHQKHVLCGLHTLNALNLYYTRKTDSLVGDKYVEGLLDRGVFRFEDVVQYNDQLKGVPRYTLINGAFDKTSGQPTSAAVGDQFQKWNNNLVDGYDAIGLSMTFESAETGGGLPHSVMLARDNDGVYKMFDSRFEDPIPLEATSMSAALSESLQRFGQGNLAIEQGAPNGSFEVLVPVATTISNTTVASTATSTSANVSNTATGVVNTSASTNVSTRPRVNSDTPRSPSQ